MKTKSKLTGWSTKAIHAGEESLPKTGALIPPIYQNSNLFVKIVKKGCK